MKFDRKIEEMRLDGKLSDEQAQALRASLGAGNPSCGARFHRALPSRALVAAILLAGVMTILVVTGGSPHDETVQNVAEILNQPGKVGAMNKSASALLSVIALALPVVIWVIVSYNGLVSREEDVLSAWAQVETNYQRRSDLIPNLVRTVDAYAEHEKSTLVDVASLRRGLDEAQKKNHALKDISGSAAAHLDDETYMSSVAEADAGLSKTIQGLMVQVEAYPNLKASDQFLELQAQLEGTENRIGAARMAFNENVDEFNSSLRHIPNGLIARLGDFQRKAYFKSEQGAEKGVKVQFSPSGPKP